MRGFQLVSLTPPTSTDPSIAIAASRAGGLGVLDLELADDPCAAIEAVAMMGARGRSGLGLRLDGGRGDFLAQVTRELPRDLRTVILTPAEPAELGDHVKTLRSKNLTIVLEATSLDEAALGESLGFDALIAKGHESAGRVGEETTLILLQKLLARSSLPVWAQGGIGLHTAAAVFISGASGIVLDSQLLLTRESPLPRDAREAVARMDGSETVCLGETLGNAWRVHLRPGSPRAEELSEAARRLGLDSRPRPVIQRDWHRAILERAGWDGSGRTVWVVGQDAAFAAPLARRFHTVGGVIEGIRASIEEHVRVAKALRPLDEESPLARSHGTRYPIVQGPMTRVSDTAEFALEVARGGALPFLALALMRGPDVRALLENTRTTLGDRPWGIGILGFVPLELRQEQLEAVRSLPPPFALIAGGRPDQAHELERDGIPTYLHVPSPGLLKLFLESGSRRFVFEGRECGGHVGPRSSFVLWNTMIDTILESLPAEEVAKCHVLFAAGIHDALSSSMVAAMAAPLAEKGARIGALLGTAYLFTEEAVRTGAIVGGFQQAALRCRRTVLLETGPGHATRCVDSPYAEAFRREKRRRVEEGGSAEEIRHALEELNLGRLRIASKGIDRHPRYGSDPGVPKLRSLDPDAQCREGMFMIGQLATLRDATCTIEQLHREIAIEGSARIAARETPALSQVLPARPEVPSDIAIIGISCLLPKAPDLRTYWENILNKVDAITEVPRERWDPRLYYDADPAARDKVHSRWGGFLEEIPFDPMRYGMPPNSLASIEPLQLLTLEMVREALENAGYLDRPFPRQRTSVILGAGGGVGDLGSLYAFRSLLPSFIKDPPQEILSRLPEWTEDSFPGILLNVAAGRVANRFDLGGVNCTVDAACASSLAAIYLGVKDLETGTSDMVIAGGADTAQNPFMFLCFSKTHAHSPRGRCRTFDEGADGIAISEGVSIVILKRLADAERDGDRIYAVIKSIAGSSDGRDKGLTAPRPEGQALALERAYAKAGVSPATVGLIEAHGTGTVAGDHAEVTTLKRVFEAAGASRQSCAIGSVKSMIGHTKCTAGVAGLAKVALSLYHKALPPTLHVERPNAKARFPESPFYVNSETRPWLRRLDGHPRRAGVSAFGFGGTNFHAVVEEYTDEIPGPRPAIAARWPSELCLFRGASRQEILEEVERVSSSLSEGAEPELRDLAWSLWRRASERDASGLTLALVSPSTDDLRAKLRTARDRLGTGTSELSDERGIFFSERPLARDGRIAFLFPGQGSQYPNMSRDLAMHFPEVRRAFERADEALRDRFRTPLSARVFPPPAFDEEETRAQQKALTATNVAQPALGAADLASFRLLGDLGARPDMAAGHSYGEYVALCAAGVFDERALALLSEARGRCILDAAEHDLGTMAAASEGAERLADLLKPIRDVWIANRNAPRQTVISGTHEGVRRAVEHLKSQGICAQMLPVACAFHSPLIAPARDRLAAILADVTFAAPRLDVYSNATALAYPGDPQAIAALLADHLTSPVRFADEVEAMYEAGARVFVEVGPRNVLTGLTRQILGDRPHVAIATDSPARSGLVQIQLALAELAAHGVPIDAGRLFRGRSVRSLDLRALKQETHTEPVAPTTWLTGGGSARPLHRSTPKRPTEPLPLTVRGAAETDRPAAPQITSRGSGAAAPQPPRSAGAGDRSMKVVLEFQTLMSRFLDTQRSVMQAYLQGRSRAPALQDDRTLAAADISQEIELPPLQPVADGPTESMVGGPGEPVVDGPREPAVEPQPVAAAPRESPQHRLLAIVSERTGYPPEMIDLDMNIEADLGIDSIKRVEILGAFQRAWPPEVQKQLQESMESLTRAKTLRAILELTSAAAQPEAAAIAGDPAARSAAAGASIPDGTSRREAAPPETAPPAGPSDLVPRFLMQAVEVPLEEPPDLQAADRLYLVTDDERGAAASIARALRDRGGRVALIRDGDEGAETGDGLYTADLADEASVASALRTIRDRQGPIGGLLHLLPLKGAVRENESRLEDLQDRLTGDVRTLFLLARAVRGDLVGRDGCCLVSASATGGSIEGASPTGRSPLPRHGPIAGFTKTIAVEWPEVRCKTVDFDAAAPPDAVAGALLREMASGEKDVEVAYRGSRRFVSRPASASLEETALLRPDSRWVFLVTGGARGITAEIACEIAARYRPTLVLVGRSPLPAPEESPSTSNLTDPHRLKGALLSDMRRSGREVTPAAVEATYRRLTQDREMRRYLAAMERSGATVRYVQADARDEEAMGRLIDEIDVTHGRLDGVIHGAGIIEDKLVEDKTIDSFDRVLGTKVSSALNLCRRLRPESLRCLVLFSSVAGSFGNRGQADYAAASEALNGLAADLDRRWPARVVSVNWGPWMKVGMASAEVQERFRRRGVQLVPPEGGRRALIDEIERGAKGEVEVILGDGPWRLFAETPGPVVRAGADRSIPSSSREDLPLLNGLSLSSVEDGTFELTCSLDPARDLYLLDHRLDGKPVFPAAVAMELIAEVVRRGWPEFQLLALQSFRVLNGIVVENGPRTIRVRAQIEKRAPGSKRDMAVSVSILDPDEGRSFYQASVVLGESPTAAPALRFRPLTGARPFPSSVDGAYQRWLFQGPLFRGIRSIEGINEEGITATLVPSSPERCVRGAGAGRWVIDPVVVDSGFQLAILYARVHSDMTPLPARFKSYRRFAPLAGPAIRCEFRASASAGGRVLETQTAFLDADGRLLGVLEDMELSCSRELNRLAGQSVKGGAR
jgi:acyl transferase domain-containing protein/NAD(P)H-dependent flavin oxidoreductase YrpB (nitropropane dioxygenase family)/NAD(P)-dependent dehydrogenase (short-subunit alcohol dehydrogenase family)